jgi:hypothetical protein
VEEGERVDGGGGGPPVLPLRTTRAGGGRGSLRLYVEGIASTINEVKVAQGGDEAASAMTPGTKYKEQL